MKNVLFLLIKLDGKYVSQDFKKSCFRNTNLRSLSYTTHMISDLRRKRERDRAKTPQKKNIFII